MNSNMGGKIAAGCGSLLLTAAFLVTLFGAFHVFLDPGGGISDDEAMPALIGGVLCMMFSMLVVTVGGVLALRSASTGAGASMQGGPMQGAPMQGAPMQGAAPGAGFPWHFVSGCGSLFFVLTMCLSMGAAAYTYDDLQTWQRRRDEDVRSGEMGIIIMLDESAIRRREQRLGGAGCCCFSSFLLMAGGVGGTIALIRRRRSAGG